MRKQNHGMFVLEVILEITTFQSFCCGQGDLPLDHVPQKSTQPGPEHIQNEFSGKHVPVPHHPQSIFSNDIFKSK